MIHTESINELTFLFLYSSPPLPASLLSLSTPAPPKNKNTTNPTELLNMCKKCCEGEVKDGMKDINRKRSMTDFLFCIIFAVFVAVLVICSIVGAAAGNAASLFYGTDYSGNTCGSTNLNVPEATRKDTTDKVSGFEYPLFVQRQNHSISLLVPSKQQPGKKIKMAHRKQTLPSSFLFFFSCVSASFSTPTTHLFSFFCCF